MGGSHGTAAFLMPKVRNESSVNSTPLGCSSVFYSEPSGAWNLSGT